MPLPPPPAEAHAGSRSRLEPLVSLAERLLPWRKAEALQDCSLYWLPVDGTPMSLGVRAWSLEFLARFSAALKEQQGLRCENFVRVSLMSEANRTALQSYALESKILPGLCRKPGANLQGTPQPADAERAEKEGKPLDMNQWTRDFCYWFQNKRAIEQWNKFWGDGAMAAVYLAPDPKATPPALNFPPAYRRAIPAFQQFDVDGIVAGAFALHDSFLPRSKAAFGKGLEALPIYRGIPFVLPVLETHHFLHLPAEERAACFEVFDVYLSESAAEKGLVLAFQKPFEPLLIAVLDSMRDDGLTYQLGPLA